MGAAVRIFAMLALAVAVEARHFDAGANTP